MTCICPVSLIHSRCGLEADNPATVRRANNAGVILVILVDKSVSGPWIQRCERIMKIPPACRGMPYHEISAGDAMVPASVFVVDDDTVDLILGRDVELSNVQCGIRLNHPKGMRSNRIFKGAHSPARVASVERFTAN
jgi:hypothetical protein